MKIEGIISFNNELRNFVYEKKNLRIYPKEINNLYDNIRIFTERFKERQLRLGEIINTVELFGTTYQGEAVVFYVLDYSGYDSGVISYDVIHYAKASNRDFLSLINRIEIKGHEIDLFYPSYRILEHNIKESLINVNLLESEKIENLSIFNHMLTIYFSTGYKNRFGSNDPITTYSKMVIEFVGGVNLEEAIEVVYGITNFYSFVNFRRNIQITEIIVVDGTKENNRNDKVGEIHICDFHEREVKENKPLFNVTFYDFQSDLLGLRKLISYTTSGEINHSFLPSSGEDRVINRQKLLMQFSSFEKEYSNFFGENKDLDDEYTKVRSEIRSFIEEKKINSENPEEYEHFLKVIENDKQIKRKLKNVLVMLEKDLSLNGDSGVLLSKKERGQFVEAMGKLRNDLSHGELINKYPPGIAKYEETLQILILFIVLKKAELSQNTIILLLSKIFHGRLHYKLSKLNVT